MYILSSRENPKFLKIGYTERRVEDRVKEINSGTGVMTPFGVRAVWSVEKASEMEMLIHKELDKFRIRQDREFFNIDYFDAVAIINKLIAEKYIKEIE